MTNQSNVTRAAGCALATCLFFLAIGPALNVVDELTGAGTRSSCPAMTSVSSKRHDVAQAIPAFARKFNVPCQTCHSAPPYLNATGRKFMEAGYRLPDADGTIFSIVRF